MHSTKNNYGRLIQILIGLLVLAVPFFFGVRPSDTSVAAIKIDIDTNLDGSAFFSGRNLKDRANMKSRLISLQDYSQTYHNDKYDIDIQILSSHLIDGGIEVFAVAWRDGSQIGFGSDGTVEVERFQFFNPPILVDDISGDIIRSHVDVTDGKTYSVKLREDPREALLQSLAHTIHIVGKDGSNIIPGKVGNTTSTFYPDANTESTSVDGYAMYDVFPSDNTWSQVRSQNGTTSDDSGVGGTAVYLVADSDTNRWISIMRSFYLFDTSSIDDSDTVSSATFSVKYSSSLGTKTSNFGGNVSLVESNPASNTAIANSDLEGNVSYTTKFASDAVLADFVDGTYEDFSLNASGIANISLTGVSKFGLKTDWDVDDTEPTWSSFGLERLPLYFADESGTTNDPKLVVEHAAAAVDIPGEEYIIYSDE